MTRDELVWYGRVLIWIGAGLLLFMAFTGLQVGYVSTAAVLMTIAGIALLTFSIPWKRARQDEN